MTHGLNQEQLSHLKSLDSKKKKRKFLLDCMLENIDLEISNFFSKDYVKSENVENVGKSIVFTNGMYETSNKKEIEFISIYGRKDMGNGTLVNLTNGGDGSVGVFVTNETRLKLSLMFKGENHPNFGKKLSKKTCMKKSESMKNSDKNLKGKKLPDWWKDKIRQTKLGEKNPMFGKKSPRAKKVIDIETGVVYNSIMEAANSTKYQFQYISSMLNGNKFNKTNLRYKDGL